MAVWVRTVSRACADTTFFCNAARAVATLVSDFPELDPFGAFDPLEVDPFEVDPFEVDPFCDDPVDVPPDVERFDDEPVPEVVLEPLEADGDADAELAASSAAVFACCRARLADARSDFAWMTAAERAVLSISARSSPAWTLSPTATSTRVTWPAAGNDAEPEETFSSAPVPCRLWVTEPEIAVVLTYRSVEADAAWTWRTPSAEARPTNNRPGRTRLQSLRRDRRRDLAIGALT